MGAQDTLIVLTMVSRASKACLSNNNCDIEGVLECLLSIKMVKWEMIVIIQH